MVQRLDLLGAGTSAIGLHGVPSLNGAGSFLESHIGGQQLKTLDPSARQEKGGEMECVKGTKGPAWHHVGGQIADRSAQLPQIAARPKGVEIALCVRDVLLSRATLLSDPQQTRADSTSDSREVMSTGAAVMSASISGVVPRSSVAHRATEVSR